MPARLLASALAHLRDLLLAQVAGWWAAAARGLAWAWQARPSGARGVAVLVSAGLVAASAASLARQASLPGLLPDALAWRGVAALLTRDARPGDAVVLAPAWLERAREVVPSGLPVLSTATLAGEALPGVRRVWLLSAPGAPWAGWELELELARRAARADPQRLGALEVIRYDLAAPSIPVASLVEQSVRLGAVPRATDGSAPAPAPAPAQAQAQAQAGTPTGSSVEALPLPSGERAGVRGAADSASPEPEPPALRLDLLEAAGLPTPCVVLQPEDGRAVVLHLPATPLGRTLVGHHRLLPGPGEATVRISLQAAGEDLGAFTLDPGGATQPFRLDSSRLAGRVRDLSVVISASGPGARAACLAAVALP